MMSKPKYIVILTGLSNCSVVAGVLRTFTRFAINVLARADFWYDNYGLWPWQAKPRPKMNPSQAFKDTG